MSHCYRRSYLAAGGFLAFLLLPALAGGAYIGQADAQEKASNAASKKPSLVELWSFHRATKTTEDQSPCHGSVDAPKSDLCQQWRMAEAAEKQANWSKWQALLSALAVSGLIATIIYTHMTLRLTDKTARRQLRAYVSFSKVRISSIAANKAPKVDVTILNSGQTPAYDLQASVGIGLAPYPYRDFDLSKLIPHSRTMMGPGHKVRLNVTLAKMLTQQEFIAIKAGTAALYAVSRITYKDVFDVDQITNCYLFFTKEQFEIGDGRMSICDHGNNAT